MKDLEELRKTWQRAQLNTAHLEADNRNAAKRLAVSRASTAQQKLARTYLISFYISLLLPVLAPFLVDLFHCAVWVAALYALFGLVMAAVNITFHRFILRHNFYTLPVVTALSEAYIITRRQRIINTCSIIGAVVVCITLFGQMIEQSEMAAVSGMVLGLILGLIIAYYKLRHKSELSRRIQEELKSTISNEQPS